MPELPEVEIVRQSLNKKVRNQKIKKVIVRNHKLRLKIPVNFESFLKFQKIRKIKRFSKYIIFCFLNGSYCLLHLGMTGTIHIINNNKKNFITNASFYSSPTLPKKHNHVEIIFKNLKIIYNDPRRFGFFEIIKDSSLLKKRFSKYGPEPFQSEFNVKYILSYFSKKKRTVKNFLLDQNFVSGIGNIYASEILFLSKIKPHKKAFLIGRKDCERIVINSKKILLKAIKEGGSSIRDFKNTSGKKGNFQKNFNVYERNGLSCKRIGCSGIIKKKLFQTDLLFFVIYANYDQLFN